MSRAKDLLKNTVILSLGKLLPKVVAIITLPILTGCLTKAEYGTYDLISTLVMLVIPIATLQIQSAAFRFLIDARENQEKSSEIITNIFIVTIPISVVASFIVSLCFCAYSVPVRAWIALYLFVDTIYLTLGQISRGMGDNKGFSVASISLSIISMIGVVLTVWRHGLGLEGVLVSLIVSNIVAAVFLSVRVKLWSYISMQDISLFAIKKMLAYSWPMVPNNLSNWVLKMSDRLVITGFLGIEANATYAAANKIPNLLSVAQSVLVMAWHENASITAKDKDAKEYYSQMLDRMFSLMFGITALLVAATPIIFKLLIKGDYDEAYYQMPILILAMFFFVMSSFFGGIYIAHKKTMNVGISTMVAAAINLIIDFLFVGFIGIWAGSISTLIAYVVLYYYRMFNCREFQPLTINYRKQLIQVFTMVVLLFFCFRREFFLDVINSFAAVALFVIFNRATLKSTVILARKKFSQRDRNGKG